MIVFKQIAKKLMFILLAIIILNTIIFNCFDFEFHVNAVAYGSELTDEVKNLLNNAQRTPGKMAFPVYNRKTPTADVDSESNNSPADKGSYDGTRGLFVMSDADIDIMEDFAKEHFTDDMDIATRLWTVWKYIHEETHYAYNASCKYCGKNHWTETEGRSYVWMCMVANAAQCNGYNGCMAAWLTYFGFDAYLVRGTISSQHYWCECVIDGTRYYFETGNHGKNGDGWQYFCDDCENGSGHKYTQSTSGANSYNTASFNYDNNGVTATLADGTNPLSITSEARESILGKGNGGTLTADANTNVDSNATADNSGSLSGDGIDGTNKFSDTTLRRCYYMLRHPVKAIGNLYAGICQMFHNTVAVGSIGNVFNLTWIFDFDRIKRLMIYYMIGSTIIAVIAFVLRGLKYMVSDEKTSLFAVFRDVKNYLIAVLVPLQVIILVSNSFDGISNMLVKDVTGKIAIMENTYKEFDSDSSGLVDGVVEEQDQEETQPVKEDKIVNSWSLTDDESLGQYIFRETFVDSGNGDSYSYSTLKFPNGYNYATNSVIYKEISFKDLYNTVDYEKFINDMQATVISGGDTLESIELGVPEETTDATDSTNDDIIPSEEETTNVYYSTFEDATEIAELTDSDMSNIVYSDNLPSYLYYSCNRFVPVHYNEYSDSIFYYFYDWIKYQYLAYYANNDSTDTTINYAKAFVLPGEEFDDTIVNIKSDKDITDDTEFDNYRERIMLIETNYFKGSKTGMYNMYNNIKYTRNNSYNYNDLFGLSNLFDMTTESIYEDTYAGVDDFYENARTLYVWANVTKANYINGMKTYDEFRDMVMDGDYSMIEVSPISAIIASDSWNCYKKNSIFKSGSLGAELGKWSFTPTTIAKQTGLDIEEEYKIGSTERIPFRLYASSVMINEQDIEVTKLENKLCQLNKQIYKDVLDTVNYMNGQVTDDTLIFVSALLATIRFNDMFDTTFNKAYPDGIEASNLDMDKITRLTYQTSISKDDSFDTIYSIYDQTAGFFTILLVVINEVLIIFSCVIRTLVLAVFFLGVILLTLNYLRGKMPSQNMLFSGLIWQLISLFTMHLIIVLSINININLLGNIENGYVKVLLSLISCIIYFFVAVVNTAMLLILVKDIRHFGGIQINKFINNIMSQVDESTRAVGEKLELGNVSLNLSKEERQKLIRELNNVKLNTIDKLREASSIDSTVNVEHFELLSKTEDDYKRNQVLLDNLNNKCISFYIDGTEFKLNNGTFECVGKSNKTDKMLKKGYCYKLNQFKINKNKSSDESNVVYDYLIKTIVVDNKDKKIFFEGKYVSCNYLIKQGYVVLDCEDLIEADGESVILNNEIVSREYAKQLYEQSIDK